MQLFKTCYNGKVHFSGAKQYRRYRDVKDEVKCKCGCKTIDPSFWKDEKIPYKVGESCNKCGSVYRHPKTWIGRCSVCENDPHTHH